MRKYLIAVGLGVAVLVCISGAGAEAPDKSPPVSKKSAPAPKPRKVFNPAVKFDQFTKDLALTKEQQKDIKPILDELEKKLLPFKKLTFQRLGQRGAPVVAEYYQKIRDKLDTEQLQKFNDKVAKGEITPFIR